MSKSKPLNERIETAREEIKQRENRLKELLQKQKAQDRKDRNHRLCERGAYLESILPDTIPLTFEQFKTFLNKTMQTDFANKILRGLASGNAAADITKQDNVNVTLQSDKAAHGGATPATAGITATPRQAG